MTSTRVQDFHIADWLPPGVHLSDLIAGLAGLAALLTAMAVWHALRGQGAFERRFSHIVERKEDLRRAALAAPRRRQHGSSVGLMRQAVTRLNLLRSQHAEQARTMLTRAGIRSQDAVVGYLFAQVTLPILFGFAVALNGYALHVVPVPPRFQMIATMIAIIAGFYTPKTYLRNAATKRAKALQLALPDGLDLMVICAEAGLSLDATLVRVSRELAGTWPALAEELGITAAELTFLPDRRVALDNLNVRTNCESIRSVVNTLLQTAKFGTPLAHSLRVLAAEFRTQRMTRAEEKAARLPALLTVPMIVFILPTLFIVLLGPAVLGIIDVMSGKSRQTPTSVIASREGGGLSSGGVVSTGAGPAQSLPPAGDTGNAAGDDNPALPTDQAVPSGGSVSATAPPKETAAAPDDKSAQLPAASLRPTQESYRLGERIVVDVDARALASGFDERVAVVPAGAPEAVADRAEFIRTSTPVPPAETRILLSAAAAGPSEVRLYYVPHFSRQFALAARAKVEIAAAAPISGPAPAR
ncbi:MAG TPA: type II secretion system F family protein [Stellaceae bacterium]|nr:type II secretion system F family protein [Stellaceae bacterium]